MIETCLAAAGISLLVSWLIIVTEGVHGRHTADTVAGSPQKINPVIVPRVGGIAIFSGLIAGAIFSAYKSGDGYWWTVLILSSAPAFVGGLIEDLTKEFSVYSRLLTTFVAAGLGFFLLDARISEVQVPGIDALLAFTLVSFIFTLLAVGGIAHAMNIIDGINGLSGGVCVLMLASIATVAMSVGDTMIFNACVVMGGSVLGFLLLNYPKGLIFAGDAGAYLMGFVVAELAVMLTHRNSEVSPWFPLLLLFYPAWETLFSAYRRKFIRGRSPGAPDALHMHTLVYRRLVRWMDGSRSKHALSIRNALTAPYMWFLSLLTIVPAAFLWGWTAALQIAVLAFAILYIWLYRRIVRFRTPTGLILSSAPVDAERKAVPRPLK